MKIIAMAPGTGKSTNLLYEAAALLARGFRVYVVTSGEIVRARFELLAQKLELECPPVITVADFLRVSLVGVHPNVRFLFDDVTDIMGAVCAALGGGEHNVAAVTISCPHAGLPSKSLTTTGRVDLEWVHGPTVPRQEMP